jgi:hypothetical protein
MNNLYLLILLTLHPYLGAASQVIVSNVTNSYNNDPTTLNISVSEALRLQHVQESRIGVKTMLVVRVSSIHGETPIESLDEIEGAVYGTGLNPLHVPDDSTAVAQFRAVSHNRLIYKPLDDPNLTRPGLLDITISESTTNTKASSTSRFDSVVRPTMMNEVTRILGKTVDSAADRVLFCLPDGSLDLTVAGIGEVGGMFTFFHLGYCRKLDALMHELGHNLNFHHSGIGSLEYGDMSDYMGGLETVKPTKNNRLGSLKLNDKSNELIDGAGYPRKAFNGHKHWHSGWFQDRTTQIFPFQSQAGSVNRRRLVSFVEYSNPKMLPNDIVLIRCGSIYIQYNRAKGYNVDSSEANRVTVSEGFVDGDLSKRLASLASGEKYTYQNFEESGKALIVQVCTITIEISGVIDYADVRIYLDDGTHSQNVTCPYIEQYNNDRNFWNPETFISGIIQYDDPFRSIVSIFILLFLVLIGIALVLLCCIRIGSNKADKGSKGAAKSSRNDIDNDLDKTVIENMED